jgi:hypothetical protein
MAFFIAPGPSPYFELATRFNNKQKLYGRAKAKVTVGGDKELEKWKTRSRCGWAQQAGAFSSCANILHKHGFSNSLADFRIY